MFEIEIIKAVKYWQENTERTVNEISSDPPSEDGYVRFTMVPLKPLSDQWGGKYFSKSIKLIISMRFSCSRKAQVTLLKNSQLKIIGFHIYKHWYLIHTYQTKGTVVNRVLPTVHGGSLEIMLTTPLKKIMKIIMGWRNNMLTLPWDSCCFHYSTDHTTDLLLQGYCWFLVQ